MTTRAQTSGTARVLTGSLATGKAGTVLSAAFLGVLFVYVAAFSPIQAIHDTAHDTRHAITAPCH